MVRYMVGRTFPDGLRIPVDGEGAKVGLGVVDHNAEVGVTWVHSYVSEDKAKTFCIYDGPGPRVDPPGGVEEQPADRLDHQGQRRRPVLLHRRGVVMSQRRSPLFRRFGRLVAGPATAAMLTMGLVAVAPLFSSPASAEDSTTSCTTPVTSAPTGPATVSAKSTPYGRVLDVGAGDQAGCSLYTLTSDQLHAMTSAPFACSDNTNPTGMPCDTVLWPALLTQGDPIAGPGVNPALLGAVTHTDMPFGGPVRQVTYAGLPLYRFFLDETPEETDGANLFDPVTSPTGIWYLVNPRRGLPAPGRSQLQLETAPLGGTGPDQTVLAASMDDTFSLLPGGTFPAYTLSTDRRHDDTAGWDQGDKSACEGPCALSWPPVLTSGRPEAGPNIDQHALGIIVRPDGTHQVTYHDQPLYLYTGDAYIPSIPGISGPASINGAGVTTPWGVFNTIPPLP